VAPGADEWNQSDRGPGPSPENIAMLSALEGHDPLDLFGRQDTEDSPASVARVAGVAPSAIPSEYNSKDEPEELASQVQADSATFQLARRPVERCTSPGCTKLTGPCGGPAAEAFGVHAERSHDPKRFDSGRYGSALCCGGRNVRDTLLDGTHSCASKLGPTSGTRRWRELGSTPHAHTPVAEPRRPRK